MMMAVVVAVVDVAVELMLMFIDTFCLLCFERLVILLSMLADLSV